MFSLSEQVQKLPATPKSRLTKRAIIILGHIMLLILTIQKDDKRSNTVKELKRILEKIDVQFEYRS